MRLHWNIREDDSNSNDNGNDNRTLELALESSARGWSAIGISTDGTMTSSGEGSDVMLGWISDPVDGGEGSAVEQSKRQDEQEDCSSGCINDYWVETKFPNPPVKMDEQWGEGGRPNLLLVAAEEADGMTIFEWDRPLDTGDVVADRVIDPSVETFVIFAANEEEKPENSTFFLQHTGLTYSRVSIQFDRSRTSSLSLLSSQCLFTNGRARMQMTDTCQPTSDGSFSSSGSSSSSSDDSFPSSDSFSFSASSFSSSDVLTSSSSSYRDHSLFQFLPFL
ncbi:hypothetical protein QOT17_020710 [Balamuthia mandrillaris]